MTPLLDDRPRELRLMPITWWDPISARWRDDGGYQVGDLITLRDSGHYARGRYILRHQPTGLLLHVPGHRTRQEAIEAARFLAWDGRAVPHQDWSLAQTPADLDAPARTALQTASRTLTHRYGLYRYLAGRNHLDEERGETLTPTILGWDPRNPLRRLTTPADAPTPGVIADAAAWLDAYIDRYGPPAPVVSQAPVTGLRAE